MQNEKQSNMIHSESVKKQLNELEEKNTSKNLKGSTNEINPTITDEGLSQ